MIKSESELKKEFKKEFSNFFDGTSIVLAMAIKNPEAHIIELMWMAYSQGYMKSGKTLKIGQ